MLRALLFACFVCLLALGWPRIGSAEPETAPPAAHDYLFPGAGSFALSMATGIPFLVMSEAGVGLGNHFAVGVLAGITPTVVGAGLRPRASLDLPHQLRLLWTLPLLYYPETNQAGGIAWGLMRPTLGRFRLNAGGGAFLAAPIDRILGRAPERLASAYGASADQFRGGVWGTLVTAAAWAVGAHTSLFAEVGVVLGRHGLAGKDWIGGPPCTLSLGVATRL
jgi:hypothetical protein